MFLLLIIFSFAISGLATLFVKGRIAKYSKVPTSSGLTGAETAQHILRSRGINDVTVRQADGMMGDHYNPLNKELVLSPDIYSGNSLAAVGIAAHECGHAIQHQQAYVFLQLRSAAVGLTQFSSSLFMLPFLLMFMGLLAPYTGYMIMAVLASVVMVFNLITLPVEFDASARAKAILPELGIIRSSGEAVAVSKVLNAAALTYVAAFLVSLANVLYYLSIARGGRR